MELSTLIHPKRVKGKIDSRTVTCLDHGKGQTHGFRRDLGSKLEGEDS